MKCAPALSFKLLCSQSRALCAFIRVSCVVKDLDTTTTKVLRGSSPSSASLIDAPSTFSAKRKSSLALPLAANASATRRGPRSEPPIPIWTTALNFPSLRIFVAKALIRSRIALTSALTSSLPPTPRSAGWSTARSSEVLIASPAKKRARQPSRSIFAATDSSASSPERLSACLELSKRSGPSSRTKRDRRLGSASKSALIFSLSFT